MTTSRNKINLAAVAKESQEEQSRNSHSQSTAASQINEVYITQMPQLEDKKTVSRVQ